MYMSRPVYVYGFQRSFMSICTCMSCVCLHYMTMYSALRIPLVSNCATEITFIIIMIIFFQ